jgi:hypothetical protein
VPGSWRRLPVEDDDGAPPPCNGRVCGCVWLVIVAAGGGGAEGEVQVRRSTAGAVAAAAALTAAVLAGCGGATQPAPPGGAAPSSSPSAAPGPTFAWPDPSLVVVTTPRGERPPVTQDDIDRRPDLAWWVENEGLTYEEAAREAMDQEVFSPFAEQVPQVLGDRYSAIAYGDPEDDSVPPWVAYTGDAPPPAELVALAEELPYAVELRGGAVMSDAERERVLQAGLDVFTEDVGSPNWGGGLDAPTGHYEIDYVPDGAKKRADDATAAAMVAATVRALGRDAPITVVFRPDDTDPTTTTPAVWFLPSGSTPDPAATSVEVLVYEQGCTSGQGAAGNTAPPEVEVTSTQVRIAVSTYIRKGNQACPNHPTAPLVVGLGQPLGDRTLVDVHGHIDDGLGEGVNLWGDVQVPAAG